MSFIEAYNILRGRGWNMEGAYAIVDQLVADSMLDNITVEELVALSDDYADR